MSEGIEYQSLETLVLLPTNPKDHDLGAIIASLQRWGFADPIGVNRATGHIFDGNGSVKALRAMKTRGMEPPKGIRVEGNSWLVPLFPFDVPEKDEAMLAIALNRTNELGG